METKNKDTKNIIIKNNGRRIGEICTYNKNLKKVAAIAAFSLISVSSFLLGRASKSRPVNNIAINVLSDTYFDEPTYNTIPYTVRDGDTLLDIVYSYESDKDKVATNIKLIEQYNNIEANTIFSGKTIYLMGVPSSKLEEFGYTDNYNYFDATVEADLRLDFLNKIVDYLLTHNNYDDNFIVSVRQAEANYKEYQIEHVDGDEERLDEIINTLRKLSDYAKNFGYTFENNLKALPLSEATRNEGRTRN